MFHLTWTALLITYGVYLGNGTRLRLLFTRLQRLRLSAVERAERCRQRLAMAEAQRDLYAAAYAAAVPTSTSRKVLGGCPGPHGGEANTRGVA